MHLFLKWLAVCRPNMSPPISFLISNYGRKAFQGSEGGSTYSLLANGCTIGTDYELLSGGGEIWETFDGEIFMVKVGVVADRLVSLLYHRKNPRLCVVVSVGANDKIDFLVRGVLAESLNQTEERIFWSGGHNGRGEDGRA
jgi:hypothetical protein